MRSYVEICEGHIIWTIDDNQFFIYNKGYPRLRIDFMPATLKYGPLPIAQYDRPPHGQSSTYYHDRLDDDRNFCTITKFK